MKHNYTCKNQILLLLPVLLSLSLFHTNVFSQALIKVPFAPRTSQSSALGDFKGKQTFSLQGDFTMIGNANAFVDPYSDEGNNNGNMKFTKLKDDPPGIVNSSSADFLFPRRVDPACTKIIYAGLYWAGRGDDNSGDVLSKKNNAGNNLNKKQVKFKAPGMTDYVDLSTTDIYFGGADVSGMYAGYYDVTDYVKKAGAGTYAVGNIATFDGTDPEATFGAVGYYGGWGMVIVYENSALKWRNITVFDGFAKIAASGAGETTGRLDISGFRTVQNGAVNIKLGVMAGEGDRSITGDFFRIKKLNTNNFQTLSHGGNTADNFFNSSIFTGGNARSPNRINNYGIDVAVFDLPNTDNVLIGNNQTSTSFTFGTTRDTYSIFNITFAVDSYVPRIDAVNLPTTPGLKNNDQVVPGQDLEFEMDIYNKGSEAIKDSKVEIPLPPNVHFVSANVILGGGTAAWSHPYSTDPSITPGGKIVWSIGDIPLPADPATIVEKLKYKVKVTNDCTLLTTSASDCNKAIALTGKYIGTGALSSADAGSGLISGYQDGGQCSSGGSPVRDPFTFTIQADGALANCPQRNADGARIFKGCNKVILRNKIITNYPAGTKFYSQVPGSTNYEASLISGDFPMDLRGAITRYYAVVEGMASSCYLKLQTQLNCMAISNPMLPNKTKF